MVRVKSLVGRLRSYKLQGVAKKHSFFLFIWRERHSFWNCMWPLEPFWLPFTLAASLVFLGKAAASQCELSLFYSWCDPPRFSTSFWCTSDGYLEFGRSGSDSHLFQASQLPSDHPGIWFCKIPLQRNVLGWDTVWFEVSPAICTSTIEMPLSSFCRIHFLWPWGKGLVPSCSVIGNKGAYLPFLQGWVWIHWSAEFEVTKIFWRMS